MTKILVEKDSYFDSVFLMLINSSIKKQEGVMDAVVAMGTAMNKELIADLGMRDSNLTNATPNDLIIAIKADSEKNSENAVLEARKMLNKKAKIAEKQGYTAKTLNSALKADPDSNLVLISLPGEYAARETRNALNSNLNVMLFSDNVSLKDEVELKKLATEKGLLMMGPDCGTAIINGKPLCFANMIRAGNIGLVGASGTGIQEVTCCIDTFGGGITHAIGTGGRDLKNEQVGGMMMLMGIEALKNDSKTKVIVLISKPPAPAVAEEVLKALEAAGKPGVVHFIGLKGQPDRGNVYFAKNLEETALMAVALGKGEKYQTTDSVAAAEELDKIAENEAAHMAKDQKYLRGLYTGGTLADEAMILFEEQLGTIYSNNQSKEELLLKDPHQSIENTIVDLGDDIYTIGRAHPMIDPSTREDRINIEAEDAQMAVLLLDVVLGYGSHSDPAGAVLDSLKKAKEKAQTRGGYLSIIASITGTEKDFQGYQQAESKLKSIGCVVMPSNYRASVLALKIISEVNK
ncbi:MAG: acyl-CoA synthetase FdrA [Spirochaetes bacterium]|nr:acyl-CoA synthetase FdrA [Spirochaetota bacterium]